MKVLVFVSVIPSFLGRVMRQIQTRRPETELHCLCTGQLFRRKALETGANWRSIAVFSDWLRKEGLDRTADLQYLSALEREYGRPNVYLFAAGDWFAKDYPHSRMLRFLELAGRFIQSEWERAQPDIVVAEGIDCALSHLLYSFAQRAGKHYVLPASGRIPGRTTFIDNPHDRWTHAESAFARFLAQGIPEGPAAQARQYLDSIRGEGPKITDLLKVNRAGLTRIGDLAYLRRIVREHSEDPHDYQVLGPGAAVRQRVTRVFRTRWAQARFFQTPDKRDRYVLFPLHVQPEATTMTLAPFLLDQPALVANIARALPAGYQVYVKEHRYGVGRRPLGEYRRMAETPNVKLISAEADVRTLIRGSTAVTTITGTMGWEATMYGLPAVTFGRPFYDASQLTYPVGDLRELPQVLRKAVFEHRHDEARMLAFVAAMMHVTFPGQIGYELVSPPEAHSDENVIRVSQALEQEIESRLKREVAVP